jgi:hypothetical protein
MTTPAASGQGGVTVAWINNSYRRAGGATALPAADAAKIVEALNLQNKDMVAAWGEAKRASHVLVADAGSAPAGAVLAYFLYNADVAGALGYHDTDPHGNPFIRVFVETVLSNGGTTLTGSLSVSVCAGHEADEEAADPSCTATATAPNGDVWALEVSDPVESASYGVTLADGSQVAVSDFVYPSFFEAAGQPPFDHLGALTAPFTIAQGGYAIINNQSVFGNQAGAGATSDRQAAGYPEWRWQTKTFPRSRTARRMSHLLTQEDPQED